MSSVRLPKALCEVSYCFVINRAREKRRGGALGKGFFPLGFTNNFFDKEQKKMIKGELIMSNAKLRSNVLVL